MERDPLDRILPVSKSEIESTYSSHNPAINCVPESSHENYLTEGIENSKPDSVRKAKKWSRSLIVLTVTVLVTQLLTTAGYSIISPFFPQEAKKKGLTETQIGLVFASIEAAMFVMSPIYGSLVSR